VTRTKARPQVSPEVLERVVDVARLAPSIHNTQPWAWTLGDGLELWADRSRGLRYADPEGRGLVISCGAALHHAVTAARAMGLDALPTYLPDPTHPDLLARITLRQATPSVEALRLLDLVPQRCTDRRRLTSWPIPASTLARLGSAASRWHTAAAGVARPDVRLRIEQLSEDARRALAADPEIAAELRAWIGREGGDGIPGATLPPVGAAADAYPRRADPTEGLEESDTRVDRTDTLMVVSTAGDRTVDWLHAGEALSALWLEATGLGLSVVPISQAVAYAPCRDALRTELGLRHPHPQLLLRVGWAPIGRGSLNRTPRRSLEEILRRGRGARA
jgi:nitroreductase